MLKGIGSTELLIVAGLLMFLFGGRKLPELAKGIGESIKEIRKATREQV